VLTVSQCCGNAYVNFSRVERSERGPRKSRSDNPFLLLFVPRPLRICPGPSCIKIPAIRESVSQ